MTEVLDDLPFDYGAAEANPAASTIKNRRHEHAFELYGDHGPEDYADPLATWCPGCGRDKRDIDEQTRRNKLNAKRGKRIQRQRIVGLGGQNLPGNKPNHDGIGLAFSYESKSGPAAFSERAWRWLVGIPATAAQTRVLIVTDAPGKGIRARSYVVVEYGDWRDLHGEDAA